MSTICYKCFILHSAWRWRWTAVTCLNQRAVNTSILESKLLWTADVLRYGDQEFGELLLILHDGSSRVLTTEQGKKVQSCIDLQAAGGIVGEQKVMVSWPYLVEVDLIARPSTFFWVIVSLPSGWLTMSFLYGKWKVFQALYRHVHWKEANSFPWVLVNSWLQEEGGGKGG